MGNYALPPDLAQAINDMVRRIQVLENTSAIPRFTAAKRPSPATMPATIIFNTSTGKHEGSNGSLWNPLY